MENNQLSPQLLTIGTLFDDTHGYIVPIYQRNYAWQAEQIEQLLRDILDTIRDKKNSYFLGNLIVTELPQPQGFFEVIDGQQRLTTLYLLLTFLAERGLSDALPRDCLRYESRPRATEALRRISSDPTYQSDAASKAPAKEDAGILQGYNVIRQFMAQYMKDEAEWCKFADFLRAQVTVVRAALPPKTDFNRYFEVMNTRGQQLQQADIIKARLMHYLDDDAQRACFAWIWEACSDMDSYVQMTLTPEKTELRKQLFGDDWTWLTATSFGQLLSIYRSSNKSAPRGALSSSSLTLDDALEKYEKMGVEKKMEDKENVRFRSTIEFSVFLLHVLKVMNGDGEEVEGRLDDKDLIDRFAPVDKEADSAKRSQWVQAFAFKLLRCRNLFDSFVLKRQYTASNGDEGDWSLQRLIRRSSLNKQTPGYKNTFSYGADDVEEDGDIDAETNDLLTIQSMLRVTYTSTRTMHWITLLLKLLDESARNDLTEARLAAALRQYARKKVQEGFFIDEEPRGFSVNRIVFTYLDYLLWTDKKDPDFRFSFRNSIEHFYPQHPDEQQSGKVVPEQTLHWLGNLALVSVGTNSKFSNNLPYAKAHTFRATIEKQSPKLRLMAEMTRSRNGWGEEEVREHHEAMIRRLRADIEQ